MNGSDILNMLKAFGDFLTELFSAALWGLYMLLSTAYTKLCTLLESINIPILPTKSKILKESFVSGTFAIFVVIYIIYINTSTFKLFKLDKKKSQQKKNDKTVKSRKYDRISERKLLMHCFFGGALGGFIGMKLCRHKTLKPKFTVGVTIMLIVQLLLFSFILGFFGFWLYLS